MTSKIPVKDRVGRTQTIANSEDGRAEILKEYIEQIVALDGPSDQKYLVSILSDGIYQYPVLGCSGGFLGALQDAIGKHQEMSRASVKSATAIRASDMERFDAPDYMVHMIAMGPD